MAGGVAGGRTRPLRAVAAGVHGRRRAAAISPSAPSRRSGWGSVALPAVMRRVLLRRHARARAPPLWRWPPPPSASPSASSPPPASPPLDRCRPTLSVLTGTVRSAWRHSPRGGASRSKPCSWTAASRCNGWLRVRLKKGDTQEVATGDTVRLRALVRPPMPPAYPGAWDLQRDAWYSGQAGSGYALGPVERIAETPPSGSDAPGAAAAREIIARHIAAVRAGRGRRDVDHPADRRHHRHPAGRP